MGMTWRDVSASLDFEPYNIEEEKRKSLGKEAYLDILNYVDKHVKKAVFFNLSRVEIDLKDYIDIKKYSWLFDESLTFLSMCEDIMSIYSNAGYEAQYVCKEDTWKYYRKFKEGCCTSEPRCVCGIILSWKE